ncbi:hypothetical protein CCACVL1_19701 [Corchorus capsularis]|uniref:Uncharacterized protein n=1 Tax=Corchorus capsularis TaxID=210143 RepID=A0A1R3HFH1_COCAP|nr:hypothetical protein CCACVL1_19701 [Corchorus capsularis]
MDLGPFDHSVRLPPVFGEIKAAMPVKLVYD